MQHPKIHKRRLACENSKFEVFFDDIEASNGERIEDYLVVAPRQRTKKRVTGVAILPIRNGKIGLIQMYRHGIQKDVWEIPRGFMEDKEDEKFSALRELEEETGLTCKPENLTFIGYITPEASTYDARGALYIANPCAPLQDYKPNEMGHHRFQFFTIKEVEQLIEQSEIEDVSTLICFYRYLAKLK